LDYAGGRGPKSSVRVRRIQIDKGMDATMAPPAQRVSLIGKTAQVCEYVSLGCLAVIATLIFVQILLRNFVSMAFAGIEEVARFAHIALVFLLVPLLFREGLHVNIDLVTQYAGPRLKRALDAFAALLTVVYCSFFLVSEYQFMAKNGSVPSPGLGIPNIVFFAGAYLGMALLLLTAGERFVRTVHGQPEGGGR
jgi:TRAP-type C4-dicarboxylate transport system permease small subunit